MTKPHTILEIGTGNAVSLKFWEQIVEKGDTIISVDINPDMDRMGWDYKHSDRDIMLIIGDSTDKNTIKDVEQKLRGKYVDFLFIDGGHTYEVASADFKNYLPFVRNGGLVGFHDINGEQHAAKFFNELKGDKEKSRSWMRCGNPPVELPEKVGNDEFMKDLKEIITDYRHLTNDHLICTGIWWKNY